jgi:Zn-dependent M16 (insulinase) family peptidase
MPAVRNNYGAYGSAYSDNFPAACFFTYSDPNAKESLEVLSSISDSWQQCRQSLTAEQLEGYILTMHSDTSNSDGEINDATYILNCVMTGDGADYVAKSANRIKRTTLKDLEKYDGFFDKLGAQGKLVTAGSAEIINRNRDIYTMILDPFSNK